MPSHEERKGTMKKLLALILAVLMTAAMLAGCASD